MQLFDIIVIGSGFGGSVAAYKLAKSGAKVLLLERGPWRDTLPVRAMNLQQPLTPFPSGKIFYTQAIKHINAPWLPRRGLPVHKKGLFELHFNKDISVVSSSGVGGGSHVYSAMNVMPAIDNYWDNRAEGICDAEMTAHYQWIMNKMGAQQPTTNDHIPNFTGNRYSDSEHFVANHSVEQPAMSVDMSSNGSNFCNNSFLGSATGSKTTLDALLLKPAMDAGLKIAALHECKGIYRLDDHADCQYRLEVMDHNTNRIKYLHTKKVVLAAGTMNSLQILFDSRANGGLSTMPALGQGFSGNCDLPAYWAVNEKQHDLSMGTPCHGTFKLINHKPLEEQPMITQHGFSGVDQIPLLNKLTRNTLKHNLLLMGMGVDKADGSIRWKKGRLSIRYSNQNRPTLTSLSETYDEISRRSGKKVHYNTKFLLTAHPLGGARLAENAQEGVVDKNGEVFGNPGLYITDASALPAAPGSPPSMTIAAWASYVSDKIINNSVQVPTSTDPSD